MIRPAAHIAPYLISGFIAIIWLLLAEKIEIFSKRQAILFHTRVNKVFGFSYFCDKPDVMKFIQLAIVFLFILVSQSKAQNSKKGFEYTGSKTRVSMLGKSRMFSEGVKAVDYTVYWNKKKNTIAVNAGPKDKWYSINLTQIDTIHGNVTHIGMLDSIDKNADDETRRKALCEVRFLLDRITIKIGEARLEEFLVEGASVWDDNKVTINK